MGCLFFGFGWSLLVVRCLMLAFVVRDVLFLGICCFCLSVVLCVVLSVVRWLTMLIVVCFVLVVAAP